MVLSVCPDRALVAMNRLQDISVRIESRPAVNLVQLGLLSGLQKCSTTFVSRFLIGVCPSRYTAMIAYDSRFVNGHYGRVPFFWQFFPEFSRFFPVFYSFGIKFRTVTPSALARVGKLSMLGDFRPPSQD